MPRTNPKTYLPGLKRLMQGRKINYVADQISVDQSTLSLLLDCKRGASLDMAKRLALYFNTTIESLLEPSETATSLDC